MTEKDIQATLGAHYGCGFRAIHGSMNIIVPNVLMYTANLLSDWLFANQLLETRG